MNQNALRQFLFEAAKTAVDEATKKNLEKALFLHVKNNENEELEKLLPVIEKWLEQGKYASLLKVDPGLEYAYRVIDFKTEKQLQKILGLSKVNTKGYQKVKGGTLEPRPGTKLSSWSANMRSMVYSGFMGIIPKGSHLVLLKAKIKGNKFFGNIDNMAKKVTDESYQLEKEVIGIGPIEYESAVYGFRKEGQSLEGLLMDLTNMLSPVSDYDLLKKEW